MREVGPFTAATSIGAAVAADNIYKRDGTKSDNAENTAIALGIIGVGSKIFSAATTPQADTRTWDNLPQRLSFAALRLPPGEHPATLISRIASANSVISAWAPDALHRRRLTCATRSIPSPRSVH